MRLRLLSVAIMALSSCAGSPPTPSGVSRQSIDILRTCATVTSSCPGIARLNASIPELCESTTRGAVCTATGKTSRVGTSSRRHGAEYREILAAMDTPTGVCALNAIYNGNVFGPGEYAILGIWTTRNGIQQYRKASYLRDPAALDNIDTPQAFSEACARLSASLA